MGLWTLEAHYALYPPGGVYKKHLDRFSTDDLRTISIVLYLNESWVKEDGGELKLYIEKESEVVVAPSGATLVCFLSDTVEHEVLPARRARRSVAGWF